MLDELSKISLVTSFDHVDLTDLHFSACFIGALLCVYVMQLFSTNAVQVVGECVVSQWARRVGLTLLGLTLCWAMLYSSKKGWAPWPPDVFVILAIDVVLFSGVIVAFRRKRAFG